MKLFAVVCLIGFSVAAAASVNQFRWQPGTEYHFEYEGRLLTGLPELASHYSGLAIKCHVEVKVSSVDHQQLGIKISNPKYVRVNDQLHGDGSATSSNWRLIKLPPFVEVPSEYSAYLASPIVFKYGPNGAFETLTISQDEPTWSVNFKKALVSIFHIKFEEENLVDVDSNRIESSETREGEHVDYWKTKEESLDGTCDVTYQINELPAYMIQELPEKVPSPQACPKDGKYFGVVKTRDVSSCSKRSAFVFYKPGFFRCATGNCEGMWSRSSITRYVACGSSRNDLTIQSVVNEGELHQNLLGFKTEKFLTGTRQEFRLVKKVDSSSSSSQLEYPANAIRIDNLFYEYSFKRQGGASEGLPMADQADLEKSGNAYRNLPRNILFNGESRKEESREFSPAKLIPEIKNLFKQLINEDFFNQEDIVDKQINMKALGLAHAFTLLDKASIGTVYSELKSEFSGEKTQMFKNVFFDTLVMGGSVSDIVFIKEQILAGELSTMQTAAFFTFLPSYVITPTRHLLNSLFELVTSSHIRETPMLYNHAVMSFTTLIQKACVADNRETSYPTFVFGEFCNPDSEIVLVKWIPYLQRELNEARTAEKKNLLIVTLGLLSHKNVIPALVPYVEKSSEMRQQQQDSSSSSSSSSSSHETSRLTRSLAVYSFGTVGRKYPELVVPLLFSIFDNPGENTEVRIAAFNAIIHLEPTMTVFHKIAATTWREQDMEVLQVVNTALYSLSQEQAVAAMEITGSTLPRKAWLVYPLIKKTGGRFPTSASVHTSEYLKGLGIGYRKVTSWTDSKDSVLPSSIYSRIVYHLDRYQFSPIEFGARIRGGDNLVKQIVELLDPEQQGDDSRDDDDITDRIEEQLHDEWRKTIEDLKIKSREDGEAEGGIFFNLFEDSPMFVSFKSASTDVLREKINHLLKNPSAIKSLIKGEHELNVQRMFDLAPHEFNIPSDMGFPIVVEVHMPVTVSIRGKVQLNLADKNVPSIRMDVKTLFAKQLTAWVGTIIPFTGEYTLTGIEKHKVLNLPAEFHVDVNVPEHKVNLRIKPIASASRPVDVLLFKVTPYTVCQKMWDLKPMTLSENVKVIKSGNQLQHKSYRFGEYLGLNMDASVSSESRFLDFRTLLQKFKLFNYNPLNMIRFGFANGGLSETGQPSFRRHEFRLRYDPSTSTTKEVEFQLQYGYGSKLRGEPINVHMVEAEERKQDKEGILPYRVVSRALNELVRNVRNERHEKVRELLENDQVESGHALNVKYTVILKGSRTRTISYSLSFVSGFEELREKWNVHLEADGDKKVCIAGHLEWPSRVPVWKVEDIRASKFQFQYENLIGFGNNCEESKIKIVGSSKVSDKQKEHSKESDEGRLYERLRANGVPSRELEQVAEEVRRQATSMDEMDFVVKYENVPRKYTMVSHYFVEYMRAIWWANLDLNVEESRRVSSDSPRSSSEMTNEYRVRFSPSTQTFNLTVTRADGTLRFVHVPIPYPASYLFPIPVVQGGLVELAKAATGRHIHPTCQLEDKWINTYGNSSAELKIDECFYLLSGDCSSQKSWSVLVRQRSNQDSAKELKIFLGKTEIRLTPSERHSKKSTSVKVIVNGSELSVSKRGFQDVKDTKGRSIAQVKESEDGVILVKTGPVDIKFDGERVDLEASRHSKNKLCGLCGAVSTDRQDELSGPRECIYSRRELFAASYRVPLPSKPCERLPRHVEEELETESRRCTKSEEIPTKVLRAFESQAGKCSITRHEIIHRHDELCFSRLPVTDCSARCQKAVGSIHDKRVSFACLPKNRVSEHYAKKIHQGRNLKELENLPETFGVTMPLPRECVPVKKN